MPELPEVEATARALRGLVVGSRIVGVAGIDWPRMLPNVTPQGLEHALGGRSIQAVGRRGKYLLLTLDQGATLAVHRKMSGNLVLDPPHVPRPLHTHLALELDDGRELRLVDPRKFGRVYYFRSDDDLQSFLAERLGPDPLEELTLAQLASLLAARRGRLKSLLLNQFFLAGVGNLYADEILWHARLHPERAAHTLTRNEVKRLHQAIQHVLEAAIVHQGTSFRDYRGPNGERGENQDFLQVYGRHGRPCLRCGTPITRQLLAQRGTWLCPRCQRLGADSDTR